MYYALVIALILVAVLGVVSYSQSVEIAELKQQHEWAIEFSKLDKNERQQIIKSVQRDDSI